MLNGPHIVLAGGGALGNLYPGLAIAEHLRQRLPDVTITFAGDGRAVERHTVRSAGHAYLAMPGKPTPTTPLEALRFVTDNVAGFWASRWTVREQQVSLVVGMGGCASTAMVRAAHGSGIPFVLLEQNAVSSRTTRKFAHAAEAVCGTYEELRPHIPIGTPLLLSGVPGRPRFESLHHRMQSSGRQFDADPASEKRLVIIGGAGGARSLNEHMPDALGMLGDETGRWRIVHQTGEGQLQETGSRYQSRGIDALTVAHIDEMASLLEETDLVVCRSGGTTLAELAMSYSPAILVPRADNDGDCQLTNAEIVAKATGCPVIDERNASTSLAEALSHELRLLMGDNTRREKIATEMGNLARPKAASQIADLCADILCGGTREMAA